MNQWLVVTCRRWSREKREFDEATVVGVFTTMDRARAAVVEHTKNNPNDEYQVTMTACTPNEPVKA